MWVYVGDIVSMVCGLNLTSHKITFDILRSEIFKMVDRTKMAFKYEPSILVKPHRASAAIAASIEIHCDAPKSVPDPFPSVIL